jgi:hypothetical protein
MSWNWYVRTSDKSIHRSFSPVPDAVQVNAPPGDDHTWDWINDGWVYDQANAKKRAQIKVNEELRRLEKFSYLEDEILSNIEVDLIAYRSALRNYIKNLDQNSEFPVVPASLTEANFYVL